ncbi:hypothetical protein ACFL35_11880 [Candidatus Riflebacteria bacterium]
MTCQNLHLEKNEEFTRIPMLHNTAYTCRLMSSDPYIHGIIERFMQEFGIIDRGSMGGHDCPFGRGGDFENCPFKHKKYQDFYM